MEALTGDIGQRQVPHPDLAGRPGRDPVYAVRSQRESKDRVLESELTAVLGRQVAGEIPPFGTEVRVRTMVSWKLQSIVRIRESKTSSVAITKHA